MTIRKERSRLPDKNGDRGIVPPVGPIAAEDGKFPVIQRFQPCHHGIPLPVAVGAAVIQGNGDDAAGLQQRPKLNTTQSTVSATA